jgi:hypothetical protein
MFWVLPYGHLIWKLPAAMLLIAFIALIWCPWFLIFNSCYESHVFLFLGSVSLREQWLWWGLAGKGNCHWTFPIHLSGQLKVLKKETLASIRLLRLLKLKLVLFELIQGYVYFLELLVGADHVALQIVLEQVDVDHFRDHWPAKSIFGKYSTLSNIRPSIHLFDCLADLNDLGAADFLV